MILFVVIYEGIFLPISIAVIIIHHSPFSPRVTEHYKMVISKEQNVFSDCSGGWEVNDEGFSIWSLVGSSC